MIRAREWAKMRRGLRPDVFQNRIEEAVQRHHITAEEDFDLREMAEGLIEDGREWVANLNPRYEMVMEASEVNTSLFSYVTKSVISQRVMDSFSQDDFVLARMIPTEKSDVQGEIIPGVQGIGDKAEIVGEAEFYPTVTFAEDWERSPIAFKKGMVVPVTREAVFFNRTGQILKMASMIGEWLGVHREKEIADTIIDNPRGSATGGMGNRYDWQGTKYATYDTGTNWTNSHSNPLTNYADLEQAEALFDNMLDPWTGEPITVGGSQILSGRALKFKIAEMATADSIVNITGSTVETRFPNPYRGLTAATSRILQRRIIVGGNAGVAVTAANAAQYWYYGDLRKAFSWIEHWPLVVEQLGAGSWLDWTQDIIVAYKARYYGTAATRQPRAVIRNTN